MKRKLLFVLTICLISLAACTKNEVLDTTKPVIFLTGGTTHMLVGDMFVEPSVKVTDNVDTDITYTKSGDTVDPSKAGTYTIYYDATDKAGNKADQKSFTVHVYAFSDNMNIVNGGFETGDLTGWTIEEINGSSDAFNDAFVIDTNNRKEGTYFFDGSKTDDNKVGALRSSNFILGGSGWINFRLGGGNDIQTLYLAVYRATDDTMVAKFANRNPQKYGGNEFLVGYKFNLLTIDGVNLGDEFYIKIIDEKLENWAIIKIDDVKTFNLTEPSGTTYELTINQK